jgi:hypothetical protein
VTLTIKYLSNFRIVYHNLAPHNIFIKKGLVVKIKDFTNAYHSDIIYNFGNFGIKLMGGKHLVCKTMIPYVSNYEAIINSSYGD